MSELADQISEAIDATTNHAEVIDRKEWSKEMKTPRQINAERKKEGLPPLNFPLFRRVIKKLEVAPAAYSQSDVVKADDEAPCGTAACIGGWAYLLGGKPRKNDSQIEMLNKAARLLGLNTDEQCWDEGQANTVFDGDPKRNWPARFRLQWRRATTRRSQAHVAIRYLTHIIKTGKVLE